MTEKSYEPIYNLSYRKSNELISAKYKSTLLENQITAIALSRIEAEHDGEDSKLVARLYPGELKRIIGDPTNIYRTLKTVSKSITGHTMILEDGNGNFKVFPIIDDAEYQDGIFTIRFHERIKPHIFDLEKRGRYTNYELSIMTNFKKGPSFRLYEILKAHIYKSKANINDGRVDVEYNISELRFSIGLADSSDPNVVNEMARMNDNVDWDVLFKKLPKDKQKYKLWSEFERNVLKTAQKELEETADIRFEYQGIRVGRSMGRILFYVYKNTPSNIEYLNDRKRILDEGSVKNRQLEMPRDLEKYKPIYEKYVGHNALEEEDIDLFINKAGGDADLVELAISKADSSRTPIDRYVGWIVRCIERGGYEDINIINGSHERAVIIENVQKEYEKNFDETAARYWNKCKSRDDYPEFIAYLESKGEHIETWDMLYSDSEKSQHFVDWLKANGGLTKHYKQ